MPPYLCSKAIFLHLHYVQLHVKETWTLQCVVLTWHNSQLGHVVIFYLPDHEGKKITWSHTQHKVKKNDTVTLSYCIIVQQRRLHGAHAPPHFYKPLGTGGTVSRRTANKKLTKLYWPSQKRSPKRLIVLLEPKKWRGTTKKIFCPQFRARPMSPTFKFVPAPLLQYYHISSGKQHNTMLPVILTL